MNQELLWLVESYSYNDDFTELTIKTRPGITWSDGEPFSAEAVDENTVLVKVKVPATFPTV